MGKDPAFLFYPADAAEDVSHMNRLERGCYFDIIQAQKKFGRLSEELIKKILSHDFDSCWNSIKICLTYVDHMYFIEWLENSIEKRRAYSESRKNNRKGKNDDHMSNICESYVEHMGIENRNENEDIIKNEKGIKNEKRKFIPPVFEEFESFCIDNGFREIARRAYDGYVAADWHDSQGKKIKNWKQKLLHVWFREENKNKPIRNQYGRQDFTHEMFADQMAFLKDDPRP
jgi:hypothetical protein